MPNKKIAASLLAADFARLGEECQSVLEAGADMIHFVVMDNHYVPALTMGPLVCKALRDYGIQAPIDVHLMVAPVDALIEEFAKAGATYITIHPEATQHLDRSLQLIQDVGCKAGLALNPGTSVDVLEYVLERLDMILVMSVNPGFGGQSFIPSMLRKIRQVHHIIQEASHPIRLEVDGGIKAENIAEIANEGADTFVLGTGIFHAEDYRATLAQLRAELTRLMH